jgi:uncharacterized BrkB/YihY/UPF0761 family membrane protein
MVELKIADQTFKLVDIFQIVIPPFVLLLIIIFMIYFAAKNTTKGEKRLLWGWIFYNPFCFGLEYGLRYYLDSDGATIKNFIPGLWHKLNIFLLLTYAEKSH